MKITKKHLAQIIREELEAVLDEQALEETADSDRVVQGLERQLATAEKRLKAALERGDAEDRLNRFRQAVKNIKNRLRIAKQKK